MLGDGAVAHLEDDVPVGGAGLFHLAAGDGPKLVHRPRVPADPGVGGGDGLRRQILPLRLQALNFRDDLMIDVVACENDVHLHPS